MTDPAQIARGLPAELSSAIKLGGWNVGAFAYDMVKNELARHCDVCMIELTPLGLAVRAELEKMDG